MQISALNRLRGRGIKTRLRQPYDALWDLRMGVNTFGFHPAAEKHGNVDLRVHYAPTPYREIFDLLRLVDLSADDVFVDLGCGLGRAVFAASWMGVRRALGIEVVDDLFKGAEQNRRRSRPSGRDIEFLCTDALNYQHLETTVLFMFHPFGEDTMRHVFRNIEAARAVGPPRNLRVVYRNPVFDHVLQQTRWLECIGRVAPPRQGLSRSRGYASTLWRSVPS